MKPFIKKKWGVPQVYFTHDISFLMWSKMDIILPYMKYTCKTRWQSVSAIQLHLYVVWQVCMCRKRVEVTSRVCCEKRWQSVGIIQSYLYVTLAFINIPVCWWVIGNISWSLKDSTPTNGIPIWCCSIKQHKKW